MLKIFIVLSWLNVTIKPAPFDNGLLKLMSSLLHLKSLIAPSFSFIEHTLLRLLGDHIKIYESS